MKSICHHLSTDACRPCGNPGGAWPRRVASSISSARGRSKNPAKTAPALYRFTSDARVTVLSASSQSSEARELATAGYTLDDPKAPKVILVKSDKDAGGFAKGITPIDITSFDDTSLTLVRPGSAPSRWVRVEPYKYFIVLAGRIGTFYDGSGPTFPMLIKTDGRADSNRRSGHL